MPMERRSFLRLLLGGAVAAPAAVALSKMTGPILPATPKALEVAAMIEELPPLPVPKHDPVEIARRLQIAMGKMGGPNFRGEGFQELFGFGRGFCKSWRLTEDGLLVNTEPIHFRQSIHHSEVSAIMLVDPDNPNLSITAPLTRERVLQPGDFIAFDQGNLSFAPEKLDNLPDWRDKLECSCTEAHPSMSCRLHAVDALRHQEQQYVAENPFVCQECWNAGCDGTTLSKTWPFRVRPPRRFHTFSALEWHLWREHSIVGGEKRPDLDNQSSGSRY